MGLRCQKRVRVHFTELEFVEGGGGDDQSAVPHISNSR